jgi:MFS transporter, ACS family, glucarate transporter
MTDLARAAEGKGRSVPTYWIIGIFIFLNTMICYFDRVNFSVAAPTIMKHFNWDMGVLGLAMSMFGVGYILTQIPAGLLSDKFGGRKVLAGGSVGWSFFTLLTPLAGSPLLMYLVRGLLGLAEGLNFPGSTSVLSRWVPRKARARIQGLNLSGVAAGPLIATPLTVWIMTQFGWKAVFYFYGVLGFVWAAAWLFYSTEKPSEHKGMTSEDLREIESSQAAEEGVSVGDAPIRSKAVWGLAASYFCFTYTWWLFLNWLPTYLVQVRGYTTIKMGFYASLPWLAALISSNGAGWLSDALVKRGFSTGKARRTLIYFGAPAMAVCLWLASQAGNAEVAVALITATILLVGMNFPAFWSLPMDMNVQKAGFITGMMNTGSALASIVAPGVTGYVAMGFGWSAALGLGSVLAVLSAIIMALTAQGHHTGHRGPSRTDARNLPRPFPR